MSEGIITVFALDDSRIETIGFHLLLQQVSDTRDLFSFKMEVNAPNVALPSKADVDVDTWHRRMSYINGKSWEFLNKTDDNCVSFK